MTTHSFNGIPRKFQLITSFFTIFIIIFLIARFNAKFCAIDNAPDIHELVTSKLEINNNNTIPKVHVGLSIIDFSQIDILNNKFIFNGIIWFLFNPTEVSLEKIEKFSFEKGDIEKKSDGIVTIVGKNKLVRYTIKLSFRGDLLYYFFPFDDHKIFITLINESLNHLQMAFVASKNDFIVTDNNKNEGWHSSNLSVKTGYSPTELGSTNKTVYYPKAIFQINFVQDSIRYIIMIILPLLLIFLIDLFSLCLDQNEQRSTIVQLSGTNIAALFAYRFVIESITPKVGYFMLSDYLFFLFLSISFSTLVIHGFGRRLTIKQKKVYSLSIQFMVIIFFCYFLRINIFCT